LQSLSFSPKRWIEIMPIQSCATLRATTFPHRHEFMWYSFVNG